MRGERQTKDGEAQGPASVSRPIQVWTVAEIDKELAFSAIWVFPARHSHATAFVWEIEFLKYPAPHHIHKMHAFSCVCVQVFKKLFERTNGGLLSPVGRWLPAASRSPPWTTKFGSALFVPDLVFVKF